jgi:hypothetical protein
MIARRWRWVPAFVSLAAIACTSSMGRQDSSRAAPQADRLQTIDHLTPARDSTGLAPTRFEWTSVAGADSYAIGVWSEVDVTVWRRAGIRTPWVAWPNELTLEPGTYFWSVMAFRNEQPIAESGLSAFVVFARD